MTSCFEIIHDHLSADYFKNTLIKGSHISNRYTVKDGTESVMGVAFRKRGHLSSVVFPDSLLSIGDASFSHCKALKKITIPASVENIGVAAFCNSGLEEITFLGIPNVIDYKAFYGCDNLKLIYAPVGTIDIFAKYFTRSILKELDTKVATEQDEPQYYPQPGRVVRQLDMFGGGQTYVENPNLFSTFQTRRPEIQAATAHQTSTDLFGQPIKKRSTLTYNYHDFSWVQGDVVNLNELFSGPTALIGDPSYQFRRKCLFVFMKSKTISQIQASEQYTIPANTSKFMSKYQEKYGSRQARIFLFICDDGKAATFFDEVRYVSTGSDSITVKSVL